MITGIERLDAWEHFRRLGVSITNDAPLKFSSLVKKIDPKLSASLEVSPYSTIVDDLLYFNSWIAKTYSATIELSSIEKEKGFLCFDALVPAIVFHRWANPKFSFKFQDQELTIQLVENDSETGINLLAERPFAQSSPFIRQGQDQIRCIPLPNLKPQVTHIRLSPPNANNKIEIETCSTEDVPSDIISYCVIKSVIAAKPKGIWHFDRQLFQILLASQNKQDSLNWLVPVNQPIFENFYLNSENILSITDKALKFCTLI